MSSAVYIGDEVSAAGYRLAGVRVYCPEPAELPAILQTAAAEASLIMLSAGLAQHLPAMELERLQAAIRPPLLVVPDISRGAPLPDLANRLRRGLGMLE
jgi:vacuolar-type H+-ATPase subunit F/Vma7